MVVLSLVFRGLYAPHGPLNAVLGALGLPQPTWLLDPDLALPAIMAMDVWSASGYYMVIFLAGLEAIPRELYEAAKLEGASWWSCFVHITLPLLRPTLLFVLVVNTVRSLQIFAEVFVMTRGGPLHRTTTMVYYLLRAGASTASISATRAPSPTCCSGSRCCWHLCRSRSSAAAREPA